jgi:hypothetical protein
MCRLRRRKVGPREWMSGGYSLTITWLLMGLIGFCILFYCHSRTCSSWSWRATHDASLVMLQKETLIDLQLQITRLTWAAAEMIPFYKPSAPNGGIHLRDHWEKSSPNGSRRPMMPAGDLEPETTGVTSDSVSLDSGRATGSQPLESLGSAGGCNLWSL